MNHLLYMKSFIKVEEKFYSCNVYSIVDVIYRKSWSEKSWILVLELIYD
jgi:hypothetical protein